MKKRLAIITTHPIQYNAPFFELLHARNKLDIKIFYTWGKEALEEKYDPGFGKKIKWDIDLLKGYPYQFLENVSKDKGSHHFNGIDNPSLIDTINEFQPDAVLIYGWPLKSHYKAMKFFKGRIPVYFRGDSILKDSDNVFRRFLKRIYISWVYRSIDFAFYTGKKNKAYFLHYGLKETQLIFAPHAVNNLYFEEQLKLNNNKPSVWRASLQIPQEAVVFLYAGKLDENKNTRFFLNAFLELNNPNCHVIVAGDGVEKGKLLAEFDEHTNIHFLPFQNQSAMPFLYGMADVFVLPSLNETWGLSVNEAMVCGCAVLVSSSVGAAIDLVINGQNGFVFNVNDNLDFLRKLKALSQKKDAKAMGQNASNEIRNWTFDSFCNALEKSLLAYT
jgi:glycosyltransferase involved in cell wall biosynthesis